MADEQTEADAQNHLDELRDKILGGDVTITSKQYIKAEQAAEAARSDGAPTDFRTADRNAVEAELDRIGHFVRRRR